MSVGIKTNIVKTKITLHVLAQQFLANSGLFLFLLTIVQKNVDMSGKRTHVYTDPLDHRKGPLLLLCLLVAQANISSVSHKQN